MLHNHFKLWLLICLNLYLSHAKEELIFSQAIFRHGERTPSDPFPNGPHKDQFKIGFGQMTYKGLSNQVKLGKWLRNHYVENTGFLSKEYNYNEIFVRSSDHSRAIQSASAFATGLYPTYPKDQTATEDVENLPSGFVPVPVYTFNAELDKINRPIPNCKHLLRLQTEGILSSLQGQLLTHENYDFLEKLSNLTGQQMTIYNSFQVADYIEAMRRFNLTIPEAFNNVYNQSRAIELKFLRLLNGIDMQDPELKVDLQTGMGGGLLNEIVSRMELKIDCLNAKNTTIECEKIHKLKMYVYSSHDITMLGLFGALDMDFLDADRNVLPEFSSLLLVELWRMESGDFSVKWKYRRPSVLNGTLIDLNVIYDNLDTLRQKANLIKAVPDQKTWCDETAVERTNNLC